ncbi:Pro-kumamolisin, activation domain-containing protein [Hypoxylon sp. FL1150]|nr:Pro-kumamolisin, activation domain-containing protein [Hypoxylon sp. FL1150]
MGDIWCASRESASPTPAPKAVAHERRNVHYEMTRAKRDRVPRGDVFEMRIGLKRQNLDRGYELLMDVSNLKSPHYGKYWQPEEMVQMFVPAENTIKAVRKWLE